MSAHVLLNLLLPVGEKRSNERNAVNCSRLLSSLKCLIFLCVIRLIILILVIVLFI